MRNRFYSEEIFCSSIEGQGVKNSNRIADSIFEHINKSNLIIYVLTSNFLKSSYCMQELGYAWSTGDFENKIFILKSNDLNDDEIRGFINKEYKYSTFTIEGLSSLVDRLIQCFNLNTKISTINTAINKLISKISPIQNTLLIDKNKSEKQKEKEYVSNLEKQYNLLREGQKAIIAELYFSENGVGYYPLSDAVIGSLERKLFILRVTNQSDINMHFGYELQTWAINFIDKHQNIQDELKKIYKKYNSSNRKNSYWGY